ncbi:MAG: methyltransferase domain-containing protein [Alphaproteobacteria bacterium]
MRPHVIDLNEFYAGRLGHMARRLIRRRVREMWPDVSGFSMLALGYPTPYLRPFRDEAERLLVMMPARQGVVQWPADGPNQVALADESDLPLPDASVDRVLLVHALEASEEMRPMLREVWRVMASGGRMLVVVPNRRGIWARFERTPFGHGYPFTPPQLMRLLRENLFSPLQSKAALYAPPSDSRMVLRAATAWEQLGARFGRTFAGVLVVEASKQVYAVTPSPVRRRRRRPRPVAVPEGATALEKI